jgi:uncharacterized membrane protein YcjF (UPF0283 family)
MSENSILRKILEEKVEKLQESERNVIEIGIKIIDHKRAFLGNVMTIAAAILAGLFFLLTTKELSVCTYHLAMASGIGFALSIVAASIYLLAIFSHESVVNDRRLKFVRESRQELIRKFNNHEINNIVDYEEHVKQKMGEEKNLTTQDKTWIVEEKWFVAVGFLFGGSCLVLLATFLSKTFQ